MNANVSCCEEKLARYLESMLSVADYSDGKCLPDILIGSKKSRLGSRPCQEHYDYLASVTNQYIEAKEPIQVHTRWGAAKGYGLCSLQTADLSDILALRRFAALSASVKTVHDAGIRVKILWEDVTELALNQQGLLSSADCINAYHEHLCDCIRTLGLDFIEIVPESRLLADNGTDLTCYFSKVRRNADLMTSYYQVVSTTDHPEQSAEYASLATAGWKGVIPKEQWEYYISRAASEMPGQPTAKLLQSVCVYLGNALARGQVKMLRHTGLPPIMFSFVPYPPGTPHQLMKGRIECKVKDSKNSNKTIPPWAGYGVFTGDDCSVIGVQEMISKQNELEMVSASMNDVKINVLVA